MGASVFFEQARGKTADEAFARAVEQACYDHGHSGYSGTIAEKQNFTMIPVPKGEDPVAFANRLIDEADSRVNDKWGPAGCLDLGDGEFLFFGWASS